MIDWKNRYSPKQQQNFMKFKKKWFWTNDLIDLGLNILEKGENYNVLFKNIFDANKMKKYLGKWFKCKSIVNVPNLIK